MRKIFIEIFGQFLGCKDTLKYSIIQTLKSERETNK